jgi:hypothetical protein
MFKAMRAASAILRDDGNDEMRRLALMLVIAAALADCANAALGSEHGHGR